MSVDGDEPLTRFVFQSNQFPSKSGAKTFEPKFDLERQRFETSVFRTPSLMSMEERWAIAAAHVERDKPCKGCATIMTSAVVAPFADDKLPDVRLNVIEDHPPERHAVIIDWPPGDDRKPERKLIQLILASRVLSFVER